VIEPPGNQETTMGFFDTLRRVLTGERQRPAEAPTDQRLAHEQPDSASPSTSSEATTPGPDVYDRVQWHKKLKRILDELPGSETEWADLMAEARALGFEAEWVEKCQTEEFTMLVRRAVSDRQVTEAEHRKIDRARDLIGLSEERAEAILHEVIAEAEAFFGKPVKDE
jgi:hypothetical protein